ncbi:MAG: hypothetical protein JKY54_02580 [Flavobacteriales bacterium]|nr:hypothetical protein [Flavobacteriales bacterium]
MNRLLFLALFLISISLSAQETSYYEYVNYRGDTSQLLTIHDPTICDCIKKDRHNDDQMEICDKKYDYDFMSEEEQQEFDIYVEICRNPSICDCALADMTDRGLIKSCDRKYRKSWHSDQERKAYLVDMRACTEADLSYAKLFAEANKELDICDCINIPEYDYMLRGDCDEKFFNEEEFDKEQVDANNLSLQACIANNEFSIDPTLCECAEFSATDEEFKKACAQKYNTDEMDPNDLVDYEKAVDLCKDLSFYKRLNVLVDSIHELERDSLSEESLENEFEGLRDLNDLFNGEWDSGNGRNGLGNFEEEMEFDLMDALMDYEEPAREVKESRIGHLEDDMKILLRNEATVEICNCHQLKEHQTWNINRCAEYYRLDLLSEKELETLRKMQSKCPENPVVKTICDCIEIADFDKSDEEKEKCKTLLKPLSTSELIGYMNGSKTCEEEK